MKLSTLATLAGTLASAALALELPPGVPRNALEFREKHPVTKRSTDDRKTVTPRASVHELDDVSAEFEQAVRQANHGGTVHLPKNQTFVIGKPLDLTFLDDFHLHLEGTLKFTNDTPYWQANAFSHPFQRSLMFWKWGGEFENKASRAARCEEASKLTHWVNLPVGKDIKIYGEGTMDGNGQRWWNEFASRQYALSLHLFQAWAPGSANKEQDSAPRQQVSASHPLLRREHHEPGDHGHPDEEQPCVA